MGEGSAKNHPNRGTTLGGAVRNWPTPQVDDSKNSGHNQDRRQTLASKVWYQTPTANEDSAGTPEGNMQKMLGNCEEVRGGTPEGWKKGVLNPDWVEWLMGWPVGWSSLEPLEKPVFRDWSTDPADTGEIPRVTTVKTNRVSRLKAIGNGQVPACVYAMEQINPGVETA
jgi:hypothetical protein